MLHHQQQQGGEQQGGGSEQRQRQQGGEQPDGQRQQRQQQGGLHQLHQQGGERQQGGRQQLQQQGGIHQQQQQVRRALQLPEQEAPFPVRFEREAEARQREEAVMQAQRIAELEATELSSDETETDSGILPSDLEDYVWDGKLGDAGVLDSSDDLGALCEELWGMGWD
jgi:hypothetical protein